MEFPNFHRVMTNSSLLSTDYLTKLEITSTQRKKLKSARESLRDEILNKFREIQAYLNPGESIFPFPQGNEYRLKNPRFKMQGSYAYHTLNRGAHMPPQQIDLDDGLFLPVKFDRQTGLPIVNSSALFTGLHNILKPLCEKKRWKLNTPPKPSCIRVELEDGESHIDIAIYAIDEENYEQVQAVLRNRGITDEISIFDGIYKSIPHEYLLLAHRKEGWVQSDPRKLEKWFHDSVNVHGEQLRRMCRYLKGWRDYNFVDCNLSSIALMKIVVDIYNSGKYDFIQNRDDLALFFLAQELPSYLQNRIANPVIHGKFLDDGWTQEGRSKLVSSAHNFYSQINTAFHQSEANEIIRSLISIFGNRIPTNPDLVITKQSTSSTKTENSLLGLTGSISSKPSKAVEKRGGGRYA